MNGELASQESRALAHAGQAESLSLIELRIEAHAWIGDLQHEVEGITRETHFRFPRAAVPDHVVQRLLRNAIEAERYVGIDVLRDNFTLEHHVDGALA